MALDYRYVVGRKKMRDCNSEVIEDPKIVAVNVCIVSTGEIGTSFITDGLYKYGENSSVSVTIDGITKKYLGKFVEVIK
jgi:hypothetical protein